MLLLLVRHAESENNALLDRLRTEHGGHDDGDDEAMKEQYSLLKSTDPGLSELGTEQAMRCSEWIPSYLRSMDRAGELADGAGTADGGGAGSTAVDAG